MSDNTRYVRLKPYNKKIGHVVKRYHVAQQLFIGEDQSGNPKWYKVAKSVATMLSEKLQNPNDPNSIKLFDVHTKAEYQAISLRERDLRLVELGLASASAIASGPSHQAEAKLVDRSGRGGAVPNEIPSAAKDPAPAIKVDEVGPSDGEPIQASEPVAESPPDPPHPAEAAGEPEPTSEIEATTADADVPATDTDETATTSRRRRPSGD